MATIDPTEYPEKHAKKIETVIKTAAEVSMPAGTSAKKR